MKSKLLKTILLFLVFTITTNCSKDENTPDNTIELDFIIGTWKYQNPWDSCSEKSIFVYKENGDFDEEYYEIVSGICELYVGDYTWSKISDGKYLFDYRPEANEEEVVDIEFPNSNRMIITRTSGDEISYYK